jgi:hypothetical protein
MAAAQRTPSVAPAERTRTRTNSWKLHRPGPLWQPHKPGGIRVAMPPKAAVYLKRTKDEYGPPTRSLARRAALPGDACRITPPVRDAQPFEPGDRLQRCLAAVQAGEKWQATTGRTDSGVGNGLEGAKEDEVRLHGGPASHSIVTIYGGTASPYGMIA